MLMDVSPDYGLNVENLHKSYALGDRFIPVLQGLEVKVARGELVVIMGPSGSGKTTLLNCISGIDVPDKGQVNIGGDQVDLNSVQERTLLRRYRVGIVFQFFNLIPTLTVNENVGLPFVIAQRSGPDVDSRVESIVDSVGLGHRQAHYPHQLSGGEMQLASIARALVHSPDLLLADEPTGNVNPNIGRSIMDILRDTARQQDTSVLMVTHNPEHAAWADRICFLKEGVIQGQHQQNGETGCVQPIHEKLVSLGV
jgi:putative ABC transport system ATP-binding protein